MGPFQFPKPFIFLFLFPILGSTSALTNFGCSNQKFQDSTGISTQTLNTLFNNLVSQSSSTKFYKTTAGAGTQSAISGIFQCRGDVWLQRLRKKNPRHGTKAMWTINCSKNSAQRLLFKVRGCWVSKCRGNKVCGSTQVNGAGFLDRLERERALGEIGKGVVSNGYYARSVYVLGQCEGDLGRGECVKNAAEKVKTSSISGQIYLQQCYIIIPEVFPLNHWVHQL